MRPSDLDELYRGHPFARAVHERVAAIIASHGPAETRVSKSQAAFRRRRGFAWVWIPGRYLAHPDADVVVSIGLRRRIDSPRFKSVVHPSPSAWMHHLEVRSLDDLDAEVAGWLGEAFAEAGEPRSE